MCPTFPHHMLFRASGCLRILRKALKMTIGVTLSSANTQVPWAQYPCSYWSLKPLGICDFSLISKFEDDLLNVKRPFLAQGTHLAGWKLQLLSDSQQINNINLFANLIHCILKKCRALEPKDDMHHFQSRPPAPMAGKQVNLERHASSAPFFACLR